jgi:hypothetical protein
MKNNIDTELVGGGIENDWSYLRPVTYVPMWRVALEMIGFILIVGGLLYGLLWLASIGAF